MKAYIVFVDNPMDGCLLVFAETRGKAKMKWWDPWEWNCISANRVKQYDKYIKDETPKVIETNEDLLIHDPTAPPFYTNEDI